MHVIELAALHFAVQARKWFHRTTIPTGAKQIVIIIIIVYNIISRLNMSPHMPLLAVVPWAKLRGDPHLVICKMLLEDVETRVSEYQNIAFNPLLFTGQ